MADLPNVPQQLPGERRTNLRHPCRRKAVCHSTPVVTGVFSLATVRDLSVGGIGLLCDREFEVGTRLIVELVGTNSPSPIPLTPGVVHSRRQASGNWLVGCAFREPIGEDALGSLLAEAAAGEDPSSPTEFDTPQTLPQDHVGGLAQALFEQSADALFLFDPGTGLVLDANSMAQRLSGFPLRELLQVQVPYLLRSEGKTSLEALVGASRKTGFFHTQEGFFLRTAQEGVWVSVILTVSRLHVKPKPLGLVSARDVRAQNKALAQHKKTEEDLRRLLASFSECLWAAEIDAAGDWTFRYISPAVETITGQPPDYFLGGLQRWWGMVHPEDRNRWESEQARYRKGLSGLEEYRMVRPDGGVRRVRERVKVSQGTDANSRWLTGTVVDVTEREQADNPPGASVDYRSIVEAVSEAVWVIDSEGRLTFVNDQFAQLLGYPTSAMSGQPFAQFTAPEGGISPATGWQHGLEGTVQREFRFRRRDGSEVRARVSLGLFLDEAGGYTGTFGILTDLLEQTPAQEVAGKG